MTNFTDDKEFREGPDSLWPNGRSSKDNPSTERNQKKQGFFEIRRLKLIKLNASEIIGADIRTSESGDRIELSRKNQLGFPEEGLYLYKDGNIVTSISQNTVFFYDNNGDPSAVIQMSTAGNLAVSSNSSLLLTSGSTSIQIFAGGHIQITGIPTSNPGGSGILWNDGGTLKIT